MKPVLVERRLIHRLRSIHARVHMLLAAEALVQHLLYGRLFTAAREQLLHGLLLLSDKVAQVDVVLVKVHDATRINRGRT